MLEGKRSITDRNRPVVVVGGGAAGFNAALSCRTHYPEKPVTIVDAEEQIGYYRPLLAQFVVSKIDKDKLFFWQPNHDPLLTLKLNQNAASLDREKRLLHLEDGETLAYDRLILTPGGRPFIPPVCYSQSCRLGVFPIRSLTEAKAIRRWLPEHRNVTILGGGLVGIKTAVQLTLSGFPCVLVEKETHLLPNLMSSRPAGPIADHLCSLGVDIRIHSTVEEIRVGELGELKEVRISGKWMLCDTLLVAIGSTPEVDFLADSGLLADNELVVGPTLQTSDRYVFAAGDAVTIKTAEGSKNTPWTWPQAVSQGKLAGANLYRSAPIALNRLSRVNAQNIAGLPLVVLGGEPARSCVYSESVHQPQWWREWCQHQDRIIGGALVGNISDAGPLHAKIATGNIVQDDIVKPGTRAFSRATWRHLRQRRQVRLFHLKETGP